MSDDTAPRTPAGTPALLKGRILMLYAGAGNKFVSRHLELHPGKLHVLLDGTIEPQQIISLRNCILADYPDKEHAQLGFALCRSVSEVDASGSPSRLGQLVFVCFKVEHKHIWMEQIHDEIWKASEGEGGGGNAASSTNSSSGASAAAGAMTTSKAGTAASAVKQSLLNKIRFNAADFVIDRGTRPPLMQTFLLKRTGNFMQEYVVRWCELRDRISSEPVTALGGIIYATYSMAPPGGWSVVPMRVDTTITRSAEKCRIAVAGPNQDSVFFRCSSQEQMEEWASTLEMLVERAILENDPQFAMQMKLGDGGAFAPRNLTGGGKMDQEELDQTMTMTMAKLRKLQVGGEDDDDKVGHDAARGGATATKLAWGKDSDDEADDEIDARNRKSRRGGSGSGGDGDCEEDRSDSDCDSTDTNYELNDLASDSPRRLHFAKVLYALERTVHADKDSSSKVIARLQEIIHSSPSMFRPQLSPFVPRGTTAFNSERQSQQQQQQQQQQHPMSPASPAPREELAPVTVEDVLERFERRLHVAVELLGPSAVVQRLLRELDADASDLKYVALHVLDTFPRHVRAAQIAAKIDESLSSFQAIRESVLVRADMARFREEFRIASGTTMASGVTVDEALKVINRIISGPQQESCGGGGGGGGLASSPILPALDGSSLQRHHHHHRGAGSAAGGADSTHKLRDAMQFLTHFMTQFREAYDVYDDAGYIIEEVGSAVERATKFLQEL